MTFSLALSLALQSSCTSREFPPLCGYDNEEQRFIENNRFTGDHGAEQEKWEAWGLCDKEICAVVTWTTVYLKYLLK